MELPLAGAILAAGFEKHRNQLFPGQFAIKPGNKTAAAAAATLIDSDVHVQALIRNLWQINKQLKFSKTLLNAAMKDFVKL